MDYSLKEIEKYANDCVFFGKRLREGIERNRRTVSEVSNAITFTDEIKAIMVASIENETIVYLNSLISTPPTLPVKEEIPVVEEPAEEPPVEDVPIEEPTEAVEEPIEEQPVNETVPESITPISVTVEKNTPANIELIATDVDGDDLTYIIVESPVNGTIDSDGTANVTYIPVVDYVGTDFFTFLANDGEANSNIATVNIEVIEPNNPPVAG